MADAVETATKSVEKAKSLITLIEDLTGKSEASDTAAAEAPTDPSGARAAVAGYRKTARWILAAFAAVGLVVFGSLPFANVTRLEGAGKHVLLFGGLVVVGLGVVLSVGAVALTMAPVRASLDEFAAEKGSPTLSSRPQPLTAPGPAGDDGSNKKKNVWSRAKCWWAETFRDEARTDEMGRLKGLLKGAENASHLGPGVRTVRDLIARIEEQDERRFAQLPVAQAAALWLQSAVDQRALVENHLAALRKELGEIAASTVVPDEEKKELCDAVRARMTSLSRALDLAASAQERAQATATTAAAALAETVARRDIYLFHRGMVIDQYGVSLVRVAFIRARRMLILAAALTLLGAMVYAYALPEDPTEGGGDPGSAATAAALAPAPEVSLRFDADGDAYRVLPAACGRDEELTAYVVSGLPVKEHGPATVVLASGECAGHQLDVGDEEGTLTLRAAE